MHLTRRIAVVIAASAVLSAGVSACGGSSGSGSSGTSSGGHSIVDKAKNDKTLTIGVKPDQPGLGLQDSAGQYTLAQIAPSAYSLTVSARGFAQTVVPSVTVQVGLNLTVIGSKDLPQDRPAGAPSAPPAAPPAAPGGTNAQGEAEF